MNERTRELLWRWGPLGVIGCVLVWHSLLYNFVTDDAFISFVFSRNFAESGELVFNSGDRVEGYTNFLWTFILGVLMVLKLAPEYMSRILGTGFGFSSLLIAFLLVEHLIGRGTRWAYMAPALLATSAGFACWSSGGLETQMFTFWVAMAIYAYVRGDSQGRWLRRMGIFLALAAMTRPEGVLITGVIGLHRLGVNVIRDRRLKPNRHELIALACFLGLWGGWYLWRWWYYGYPFPNTYYVKAAGPISNPAHYNKVILAAGFDYMWIFAKQSGLLFIAPLPLLGLLVAKPSSRGFFFGTLATAIALVYTVYTIRVGGDFMGLHRFIMPLFFIAAVAVTLGVRLLVHERVLSSMKIPSSKHIAVAAVVATLFTLGSAYRQIQLTRESLRYGNTRASKHGIDTPYYLRMYTHDRAAIGKAMRGCFKETDFSIVGGAGAQPYFARMRGIDVFGLVSRQIAHEVPRTNPRPGHNKWAPDHLLAKLDPDFVLSCYSLHPPNSRPGYNCNPGSWKSRGYERVTVNIPDIWERTNWSHANAPTKNWYTFWKKKGRPFECKGIVPESQWR